MPSNNYHNAAAVPLVCLVLTHRYTKAQRQRTTTATISTMMCATTSLLVCLLLQLNVPGRGLQVAIASRSRRQPTTAFSTQLASPTTRIQPAAYASKRSVLKNSYYSIETNDSGPASGPVHRLIIHSLPGQPVPTANGEADYDEDDAGDGGGNEEATATTATPIIIETGKIGRQAAGAVTLTRGDTVLYATASRDDSPREGLDFLPLSVEHQERFSSVGLTSGGYNKRDGRPAEHEVLTCRLIDRPLRPLIADGWRHETQLLSWVLSYDGIASADPLAILASSTALYLSDVPLLTPVAAAMVGYIVETDTLILNPTHAEMEKSQLQLIVAGTKEAVLMIEGASDFLPEATMVRAVTFGHEAIKALCEAVEDFGKTVGVEKKMDTLITLPEGLQERVDELMTDKVDAMYALGGTKTTQGPVKRELQQELIATLIAEDEELKTIDILNAFKDLLCRRMFERAKTTGKRCDGRALEEIRELTMETGLLPRVHGSALFTRGETQALATSVRFETLLLAPSRINLCLYCSSSISLFF